MFITLFSYRRIAALLGKWLKYAGAENSVIREGKPVFSFFRYILYPASWASWAPEVVKESIERGTYESRIEICFGLKNYM